MRHWCVVTLFVPVIAFIYYLSLPAFAWDGRWTEASSGQYPLPDTVKPYKSTHSDSGLAKDRPQHYPIAPIPAFDDVDPDELSDNTGKDYSPYAMVRLPQDIQLYGKQKITKGYYLVKIGHWRSASANQKKLLVKEGIQEAIPEQPIQPDPQDVSLLGKVKSRMSGNSMENREPYTVLIFKQNGKVLGVIPIQKREVVKLPLIQGIKPSKSPLAWVEPDVKNPGAPAVLKFYYRHSVYIAQLSQA